MKKIITIGVAVIILIIAGVVLAQKTKLFSKKDDTVETGEGEPPEMQTATVELGSISEVITASGTIVPLKIIEVSSKASGKIISMPVDKGDYLNEGDVIAEIEKTYAQNDVDQAEADLRSAQARLEQSKINIELE
ncbi:biotin/lipoyl-binding protein, partial [bacterium]|nr:biotin/lipoyl-binding protein [bacterium]